MKISTSEEERRAPPAACAQQKPTPSRTPGEGRLGSGRQEPLKRRRGEDELGGREVVINEIACYGFAQDISAHGEIQKVVVTSVVLRHFCILSGALRVQDGPKI